MKFLLEEKSNIRIFFIVLFSIIKIFLFSQTQKSNVILFFEELYTQNEIEYREIRNNKFINFCNEFQIDENSKLNQEKFYKLYFLHDMFTGSGVTDGSSGGMLKIPYFWHWLNPNPRHSILRNSDRKNLTKIRALERFSKYKSFADIDRVPSLFLSDLFTASPNYYHSDCGEFYTFGWCSEREMAFCLLLSIYDYESKIYQAGIHVNSQFWLEFVDKNNKSVIIIADVDNTFDIINWGNGSGNEKSAWLKEFGNGEQIEWYNRKAKSNSEIQLVQKIQIGEQVRTRIKTMVEDYLRIKDGK